MKEKILQALKEEQDYISGAGLSRVLGISRAAVWKHIQSLRAKGYVIASRPNAGYLLQKCPDLLLPAELKPLLETSVLGAVIKYQEEVISTNLLARDLARKGAQEGTLIVAETQSGGRGRLGRSWSSPHGGIWFSMILRPKVSPFQVPLYTLLTAVALTEALWQEESLKIGIKWPNDLLYEGKKVAGILTEVNAEVERVNYMIVGIGINANFDRELLPTEIQYKATTLKNILGRSVNRKALMCTFLKIWENLYLLTAKEGFLEMLDLWRKYNVTLGKEIEIKVGETAIKGVAQDIDERGALVLIDAAGDKKVFMAGEVTLLDTTKAN